MDGHKFRSGLTEVKGDGIHKCITMSKFCFDLLTSLRTSRAASSQLKMLCCINTHTKNTHAAFEKCQERTSFNRNKTQCTRVVSGHSQTIVYGMLWRARQRDHFWKATNVKQMNRMTPQGYFQPQRSRNRLIKLLQTKAWLIWKVVSKLNFHRDLMRHRQQWMTGTTTKYLSNQKTRI